MTTAGLRYQDEDSGAHSLCWPRHIRAPSQATLQDLRQTRACAAWNPLAACAAALALFRLPRQPTRAGSAAGKHCRPHKALAQRSRPGTGDAILGEGREALGTLAALLTDNER